MLDREFGLSLGKIKTPVILPTTTRERPSVFKQPLHKNSYRWGASRHETSPFRPRTCVLRKPDPSVGGPAARIYGIAETQRRPHPPGIGPRREVGAASAALTAHKHDSRGIPFTSYWTDAHASMPCLGELWRRRPSPSETADPRAVGLPKLIRTRHACAARQGMISNLIGGNHIQHISLCLYPCRHIFLNITLRYCRGAWPADGDRHRCGAALRLGATSAVAHRIGMRTYSPRATQLRVSRHLSAELVHKAIPSHQCALQSM